MAIPIKMPDLGTTVEEVTLAAWLKQEGEPVKRGEPLCEVETDKAVDQLESVAEGVLLRHAVPAGSEVRAGSVIAYVGSPGETIPGAAEGGGRLVHSPAVRAKPQKTGPSPSSPSGQEPDDRQAPPRTEVKLEFLLQLYRRMVLIRRFEERVKYLFLEGVMPGTIHQCNGQEACAVGVCAALEPADVITSTHRPHGHALAKGIGVQEAMGELFGRTTGCCKGKGGSMHLGDLAKGVVPAVAIVGGGIPIATGIALAFKMKQEKRVAACFMGDGAVNEGAFHEGVNMGAIWNLPVVYVVENNRYGASTPVSWVMKTKTIAERSAAYGIPGVTIDGNDVLGVYEAAKKAVDRARAGGGPTLLELMTYRITGHSRRDPALYQPEEEKKQAAANEPIGRFAKYLLGRNYAEQTHLDKIVEEADREIEAAVDAAKAAPQPEPEDALQDLFVESL
jgi:TPP-dependent pyruvate/acetoin dehydrogenase alpha subunit